MNLKLMGTPLTEEQLDAEHIALIEQNREQDICLFLHEAMELLEEARNSVSERWGIHGLISQALAKLTVINDIHEEGRRHDRR